MAGILECEISPRGHPEWADIFSLKSKIRVEVKTRASHLPLGVRVPQLEKYQDLDSLPRGIHDTLYALVSYNPRENKPRRRGEDEPIRKSLLSYRRGETSRQRLVLERLTTAYLLDIEVIEALRSRCPVKGGIFSGENRKEHPTLQLPRSSLRVRLAGGSAVETWRWLGISPANFLRESLAIEMQMAGFGPARLRLVTILRRSTHRRLMPAIRRKALTLR